MVEKLCICGMLALIACLELEVSLGLCLLSAWSNGVSFKQQRRGREGLQGPTVNLHVGSRPRKLLEPRPRCFFMTTHIVVRARWVEVALRRSRLYFYS